MTRDTRQFHVFHENFYTTVFSSVYLIAQRFSNHQLAFELNQMNRQAYVRTQRCRWLGMGLCPL